MSVEMRAEHESLEAFLEDKLSESQRSRVLVTSFNQWDFALSALSEIALTFHEMKSTVTVAMWADELPLHDVGWMTSRRIAHLCRTRTLDEAFEQALVEAGIPKSQFVAPPISRWRPAEDIAIKRPLNRSEIRRLEYRGTELGRALLQVHPDANTPVTDDHYWPKRWLQVASRSYAFVFDQVQELIRAKGLTCVVVFNGRFLNDRAAEAAARSMGIPVLYHDAGGTDTDFDLTVEPTHDWVALQHRMIHLYDAWDPAEREELGSTWFERRLIHADPANTPFVESQALGSSADLDSEKRIIVFFSSSGDEIIELDIDWTQYFESQENALQVLADLCRLQPNVTLVVRSHPHKRLKPKRDLLDWTAAVDAAAPDVHLDPLSPIDSYALMRQADVVVTYGSTAGIESAYAGKPTIVMGPSAYGVLGCAQVVATPEELAQALAETSIPEPRAALSWGLMMMRRGFFLRQVGGDPDHRTIGGVSIDPPSQRAVTLGHFLAARRTRRLLKR